MGESKKIAESSVLNSSLGTPCGDLADFGHLAQTSSLALRPKFAKNHESQTENPSVVDSANLTNSQNLGGKYCHSERSEESQKNNIIILSEAKNLKNNQNRDSSVASLPQNDNMKKAQNDKVKKSKNNKVSTRVAESSLDSADSAPLPKNTKLRSFIIGASGLSLGISIVVAIMLGVGAGILMQKIFKVAWVLFLGVFWGIAAAVLNVYKVYKAELRDFEKLANDPKYKGVK